MKQYRFGQKVQNWHRPLGRDERSAAYCRLLRDQRMEEIDNTLPFRSVMDELERKGRGIVIRPFEFGCTNDHACEDRERCEAERNRRIGCCAHNEQNLIANSYQASLALMNNLEATLGALWCSCQLHDTRLPHVEDILPPSTHLFFQRLASGSATTEMLEWEEEARLHEAFERHLFGIDTRPTEGDLVDWIHTLMYGSANPARLEGRILLAIGGLKSAQSFVRMMEERDLALQALLALAFSPFWFRHPNDWESDSATSIHDHLFEEYPIPASLSIAWYGPNCTRSLRWIILSIAMGRGMNPTRVARELGWNLGDALFQHYVDPHREIYCYRKYRYAEIMSLGGSMTHWERLLSRFRDHRDWNRAENEDFNRYWIDFARWFIHCDDAVDDEQLDSLLRWSWDRHLENAEFSMRGRSLHTCLTHIQRLELEDIEFYRDFLQWKSLGLNWEGEDAQGRVWTVRELTNTLELVKEGMAMSHCVEDYDRKCCQGKSRIFSLCCNSKRRATLELDLADYDILQFKTKHNRTPDADCHAILNRWWEWAYAQR